MSAYNCPPQTGSDPGSSSSAVHPVPDPQFSVFGRPVVYLQAPPHPPMLHYQWPMPFSGNTFPGLPGMSYGMVAPPPLLPPPPYMEVPAYILPHVQPVDYRRWLHPNFINRAAAFPNSIQRIRPPHPVPAKVTVNSEVQTESLQIDGSSHDDQCHPVSSDSGRETHSASPCSSGSSSPKQPAETRNYGFNSCEVTEDALGSNSEAVQEVQLTEDGGREPSLIPMWKDHCHLWMSSPGGVCSSSQEGETSGYVPDLLKTPGQELHMDNPREAGRPAAGRGRVKDQLNDSTWSVETMPPYIPSARWLIFNGLMKQTGEEPDENLGANPSDIWSEGGEEEPEASQCPTNTEEMEEPPLPHSLEQGGSQPCQGRLVDCGVQCNNLRECSCKKTVSLHSRGRFDQLHHTR